MNEISPLGLAKPAFDIGIFTNQIDALIEFWTSHTKVQPDHVLPVTKTLTQHRHTFGDGVLKLNEVSGDLQDKPGSAFGRILFASKNVDEPQEFTDPDGNTGVLWPYDRDGIRHWALEILTPSLDTFFEFYEQTLGLMRSSVHPQAVVCGNSLLIAKVDASIELKKATPDLQMTGLRYFTLQVFNVDEIHRRVVELGGESGAEPRTLGKTARISFIRDPFGNWIELSQRASLTGPVPENK